MRTSDLVYLCLYLSELHIEWIFVHFVQSEVLGLLRLLLLVPLNGSDRSGILQLLPQLPMNDSDCSV